MFQIEIGQRNGRMCSLVYYPPIGHSTSSQIHTAPDSPPSCATFKPEKEPAVYRRTREERAPAVPKAPPVVPPVSTGSLHLPGQGNVARFVP